MMEDGTLASGAEDNLVLLWNSGRMDCCFTFTGHTKQIWDVITMEPTKVASASEDRTIRIWDLVSGKCSKVLRGHKEGVFCLLYVEGKMIASGSKDDTIRTWNYMVWFGFFEKFIVDRRDRTSMCLLGIRRRLGV